MSKIPSKRRRLLAWGGFGVLVVLVVGYYAWLMLSVHSDLKTAQVQAAVIKRGLTEGNAEVAGRALEKFATATEDARSRTRSLPWRALGWMPVIGESTKAVTTISDVAVKVAADAIRPAVDEASGNLLRDLVPRGGQVDLVAVRGVQPTLDRIDSALTSAARRVDAIDGAGLLGVVRHPFDKLQAQLDQARSGVDAAARAAKLMPSVLGSTGPRRYLLLFENNAEIRSTGGRSE